MSEECCSYLNYVVMLQCQWRSVWGLYTVRVITCQRTWLGDRLSECASFVSPNHTVPSSFSVATSQLCACLIVHTLARPANTPHVNLP